MSLRRPTVALLSFTFDISPLCDVAQTSDCGMHYLLFPFISPLCGVALTPDCGIIILAVSSRGVIQTLVWHPVFYFGISGGLPPDFSFISRALLSLCLSALVNLFICIMLHLLYLMSELSCEYFHSTHLAC